MPTLSRFAVMVGVIVMLAYAAMFALASFVTPKQSEMSVEIPPERLNRKPAP